MIKSLMLSNILNTYQKKYVKVVVAFCFSFLLFLPLRLGGELREEKRREKIRPSSATPLRPACSCIYPPIVTPHISAAQL